MTSELYAYASSATVRRVILAAEKAGIRVGSIHFLPDRSIKIQRESIEAATPSNDFDRLEAKGWL